MLVSMRVASTPQGTDKRVDKVTGETPSKFMNQLSDVVVSALYLIRV